MITRNKSAMNSSLTSWAEGKNFLDCFSTDVLQTFRATAYKNNYRQNNLQVSVSSFLSKTQ